MLTQLGPTHSPMIHEAFIKQLLGISMEDTRKDQTQSLPSKSLNNCIGAQFSCHFRVKDLKLRSFLASALGLHSQDTCDG